MDYGARAAPGHPYRGAAFAPPGPRSERVVPFNTNIGKVMEGGELVAFVSPFTDLPVALFSFYRDDPR